MRCSVVGGVTNDHAKTISSCQTAMGIPQKLRVGYVPSKGILYLFGQGVVLQSLQVLSSLLNEQSRPDVKS